MKLTAEQKENLRKNMSKLSREQLKELAELEYELERREKENPLRDFVPNGKGEEFIRMVGENKVFVTAFIAGNGVGKTCLLANILGNICYGRQNEWFDYPLFNAWPYELRRGRIVSDPTSIKSAILPEIEKWFPKKRINITSGDIKKGDKYETAKGGKQFDSIWKTDTGFEFDVMTTEQDPKEFESANLSFCIFDEPPTHKIFMATVARMRRGGIIIMGLTPLFHSAWIKDEIFDKRDGKFVDYVTADVEANCKEHGVRGILNHEDIERMISQYPEDEKLARVEGKFGHLLGMIYKDFDLKTHVIEPFELSKDEYSIYMALDTHPRVPEAISWFAVDRKGTYFLVDELFTDGTDDEIARKIKEKEDRWGWHPVQRLIDPSAYNQDTRSNERSYADRLYDYGLSFVKGSKDLLGGIRAVQKCLRYQENKGQIIKPPQLYVFNNCRHTIKEFQNYTWDEHTGKTADNKDPKPKPKDINDHFMENVRRLVVAEFKYQEPHKKMTHGTAMGKYRNRNRKKWY